MVRFTPLMRSSPWYWTQMVPQPFFCSKDTPGVTSS